MPGHELDGVDEQILDLMRTNARRTYGDMGAQVGLSAAAVKRRVDRLESSGVIRGYTTVIDPAAHGERLEAFTELRFSGSTPVEDIEGIASDVPEVRAVFHIAGDPDALAWIRVKDVQDLKRVIDRLRSTANVTGTKTMMVLSASIRS